VVAIFFALILGVTLLAGLFDAPSALAAADFRIIGVEAEHGQMVVEAQHLHPDGSHWFYEKYTFQGREQYQRPPLTVDRDEQRRGRRGDGLRLPKRRMFLASGGREAPTRVNSIGQLEHYLPPGEQWLRASRPKLERNKILWVIQNTHNNRMATGWTKGRERLTTHPMDHTIEDATGAPQLRSRFRRLIQTAYYTQPHTGVLLAAAPPSDYINPNISSAWGTVSTFHSDGHPESNSFDGGASETATETWATLRGAAGDGSSDSAATYTVRYTASSTTDKYTVLRRGINLFDTSALPDSDVISSATFGFTAGVKNDPFSDSYSMVTSTPASNTAVANSDYAQLQDVIQAPNMSVASITTDNATFNTWTLNSTGLGNINKTGVSKFGQKFAADLVNSPTPTWSSGADQYVDYNTAEESQPGDVRPVLTVTHSTPSAAITGTVGGGATEAFVRDGGGTIIITLTDATWAAAGGTFDAQRQNIIDGLDSAQSETHGWNNEVRDTMSVTSVVRTSATIATVTLVAADVADYRVDSAETITATVPASAISISDAMTATPTIPITATSESVSVSGTLGASGGTPSEIVAGGETVILTLANVSWVASGAAFDAQRQNIIDGLDSNQSDQNGWDNRRGDFAVTDVVRTSATIVTITLSASSAYAIPAFETVTAIVPASALVYGAALTGSPSFDIVPAFALSGNRISGPIDLSGISDVAYCAIGWQATTPATTAVTVKTSVDGGVTYSSATNGACPTGITVGGSLSGISDFRIQVDLTTNDNTVTPLVEGLGLLVQDTSGPALYYQLNTVPGVTITDRSANSNTGTMSFPVSQAGVNATTGVLESTRSSLSLEQLLSVGDIVSPVTGAAVSDNLFNQTETGFGSLPFQDLMQTMATGGELPLKFVWVVAIGLFSIALGVVALHMTGSLMISGIGLGAGLSIGAAIGGGLIPGWTVVLFVILALALVVMRSRGALPL
jgi:hypothetical protein